MGGIVVVVKTLQSVRTGAHKSLEHQMVNACYPTSQINNQVATVLGGKNEIMPWIEATATIDIGDPSIQTSNMSMVRDLMRVLVANYGPPYLFESAHLCFVSFVEILVVVVVTTGLPPV
jgi:hypothetical protein